MTTTTIYQFNHQQYKYQVNDNQLVQIISRADIKTQDSNDLLLLHENNPLLLPIDYQWKDDELIITSELPLGYFAKDVRQQSTSNKLRLLINLLPVNNLNHTHKLATFIHPDNIYINYNNEPKLIYRGVTNIMPGTQTSDIDLLYQIKCLAGYLFTKNSFDDLYNGLLNKISNSSHFINDLLQINDYSKLKPFLTKAYEKAVKEEQQTIIKVTRKKWIWIKQLALWFGVALLLTLVPLGYLLIDKVPTSTACLNADTAFIDNNYSRTIKSLANIKTKNLPNTQKYELAYSYVQGKGFDNTQRKNIMKNITLKSNTRYLDFWIEDGRGQLDDALDTAKQLQDSNLIMYALLEKMDAVRNSNNLSASQRSNQLQQLQQDYSKYQQEANKSNN